MAAEGLLRTNQTRRSDDPHRDGIKYSRCTGYVKIIEAVRFAADELKSETEAA